MKTVTINAFLAFTMYQKKDFISSTASFKSLEKFRNLLNKVQSTADFMFDCSQELMHYTATLELQEERQIEKGELEKAEMDRMVKLAKRKRENVSSSSTLRMEKTLDWIWPVTARSRVQFITALHVVRIREPIIGVDTTRLFTANYAEIFFVSICTLNWQELLIYVALCQDRHFAVSSATDFDKATKTTTRRHNGIRNGSHGGVCGPHDRISGRTKHGKRGGRVRDFEGDSVAPPVLESAWLYSCWEFLAF